MGKQKLIKQIFVGKVAGVLGYNKTMELLKDATDAVCNSNKRKLTPQEEYFKTLLEIQQKERRLKEIKKYID